RRPACLAAGEAGQHLVAGPADAAEVRAVHVARDLERRLLGAAAEAVQQIVVRTGQVEPAHLHRAGGIAGDEGVRRAGDPVGAALRVGELREGVDARAVARRLRAPRVSGRAKAGSHAVLAELLHAVVRRLQRPPHDADAAVPERARAGGIL